MVFKDKSEYFDWIKKEEWYQTMRLPSGAEVNGKVPTYIRNEIFKNIDFKDKSFIDVGCNSGAYCFLAKEKGAKDVVGIDVNSKRINQARVLAMNEGLDIKFEERSIFDTDNMGRYDIVFCIAVLTEIQDLFGAIEKLKNLIGDMAYIELDLAKPLLYISRSSNWLKGGSVSRMKALTEVRLSNGRPVISPTLEVLEQAFGKEFKLRKIGGGVRYDLVEVSRLTD